VWGFVERLLTDTRATVAKYRESQAEIEQQLASARAHLIAVDELGAEYKTQRGQILKQHQMRLIDDEELEVKIMEINRYLDGLQVERHRWENFISQKAITDQQIAELERLGQEITGSSGAATWEKKRAYLEKLRLTGVAERLDDGRLVVHITIFTHTWRVPVGSSDNGETPDNEKSPYASELRQDNHIAPSKSSRILSTSTCWSS
jgi:hypothetical protein